MENNLIGDNVRLNSESYYKLSKVTLLLETSSLSTKQIQLIPDDEPGTFKSSVYLKK